MLDLSLAGTQFFDGPVGPVEVLLDVSGAGPLGVAIVAHPQPLLGGNARHKLVQYLARGLAEAGWVVLRPNFRGVGLSAGTHGLGIGETEDLLALCAQLRTQEPGLPLGLAGFSFGAFVQARVARRLLDMGAPAQRVFLAGMPCGEVEGGRRYDTPDGPPGALIVHGENDERVPLQSVLDWARPTMHPVTVIPGGDHFFTGRLHLLRALLLSHFALPSRVSETIR